MMFFGGFFWLLIIAGIVLIVAWLIPGSSWSGRRLPSDREDEESPLAILRKRYARGEINREQFERMKRDLTRNRSAMRNLHVLIPGIVLLVLGSVGLYWFRGGAWNSMYGYGPMSVRIPSSFEGNGQLIYYTATSDSGPAITFSGGPYWLYMHGGSCVNCHGVDGRGGLPIPMTGQTAPDIRYSVLTSNEPMQHGHEEHPPYTEATIARAITQGLDPAGHRLSWVMPRWSMSEQEVRDLIEYLKKP
jgi:cytochrome c oxidase subunit 2